MYNTNNIFWLLVAIATFASCKSKIDNNSRVSILPYYDEATFTPKWLDSDSEELSDFHKISSFQLYNQLGDTINQNTFQGKIYVTDFFFTACPGICPKMTQNMGILHDEFLDDDDVRLLSHSVTPKRDSIPVLKAYADEKGINSNKWHLVTGKRSEIYRLGRFDYFVEQDMGLEMDEDDFLHTENFVLVDQQKYIRGIYNGLNKTDIKQLIADIKTLQKS